MTAPTEAAVRVLWALAVGAMLGLCYDFLRPLRRRHHAPADVVFVLTALAAWIWYSFRVCAGDIRMGGTASMGIGMLLWLGTGSMVCRKVFYWFWLVIFQILSVLSLPFKKIFKKMWIFLKKVFAYGKKRGYNRKSNRNPQRHPEESIMNKQATPKKSRKKVWIKLGVFLAIIFFAAALLVIRVSLDHLNEIYKNREQQAMELEEGNQDLQNYIDNGGTDEGVKDVATGELGMVDPDTVIYDFD